MLNFVINQVFDGNLLIALFFAAIAGVVSFFSPCVIPLVPGYLSYASGMSDTKSRSRVLLGSLLFVSGFTVLFVSYGLLFGELGSQIYENSRIISVVLGLLIIALGVIFLFNEKFYRSYMENKNRINFSSIFRVCFRNWLDSVHWADIRSSSGACI